MFATHSTHKMLAAFSQASMIHVQDGGTRKLDVARFNEAFMMHISTSPQYGIIASLDVASAMMEGPAGRSLIQETFDEALSFRRALANVRQNLDRNDWWFGVWQPEQVEGTDQVAPMIGCWSRAPTGTASAISPKTTCCSIRSRSPSTTPGLSAGGKLSEQGIPAAIVSRFLWERGLVVEKTGLYSFLVLFSMGITKGKWSTLVTELLEFKRCYDANLPLLDQFLSRGRQALVALAVRDFRHPLYRRLDVLEACTWPDLAEPAEFRLVSLYHAERGQA